MDMREKIVELEKLIGCQLPEDLRSFFLNGILDIELPAEVIIPDSSQDGGDWLSEVEDLYGIDDIIGILLSDAESVKYEIREVPARTIPIGDNGNGDYFVISVRESDFGCILFMFHETTDSMDETLNGAYVLSPSISSWLESFRPMPPSNTPDWEAINKAKLEAILNPKLPWWRFLGKQHRKTKVPNKNR